MIFIVFMILLVFLFLGVPIAFSLAITGMSVVLYLANVPLTYAFQRLYMESESYALVSLPLFILTGSLMNYGGVSRRLIDLASALVGTIRAGLAMVTIVASAFFGAISGTCTGTSAAIGSIMIPSMIEQKYPRAFSAAVTSASSSLGIVIPPSLPLILYGSIAGLSVGMLFIAAIPIGIIITLLYMLTTYMMARQYSFPVGSDTWSLKQIGGAFREAIPALAIPTIILGSIAGGVATPTETAGVTVAVAIIIGMFVYKELNLERIILCLKEALISNAMVMLIVAAGGLLGWCLTYLRVGENLTTFLISFTSTQIGIMLVACLILFVAGFIFDGTVMVVIIIPLFLPVIEAAGIDPLQFAMVVLLCWCIGQQTPPVASGLYVTTAIAKTTMLSTVKYIIPYIVALGVVLFGLIYFPDYFLYFSKLLSGYTAP